MAKFPTFAVCLLLVFASPLSPTECVGQTESIEYRQALAKAVREAADRVLPSIVSIEVIGVAETAGASGQRSEVAQDAPSCGVVIDREGLVVASDIIVRRPSASLLVVLPDQTRLAAKVLARDHHRGLVMLKVEPENPLNPIELPATVETPVGSTVVAVGRYGADGSPMVSSGILSASGRLEGTMLQSDARVSPSFYGGPLIDLYGNAIGVLVPAVAPGGAPDETSWYDSGIAFAVPTPVIANKLARLAAGEDIRKGLIGIVPKSKDPYAEDTELAAVRNRSPAEKAGIEPGDVIEAIAGQPVQMFQQVKQALGPYDAGETIEIKLRRADQSRTVSVTLAESIPPLSPQRLGVWAVERILAVGDGEFAAGAGEDAAGDGEDEQPQDEQAEDEQSTDDAAAAGDKAAAGEETTVVAVRAVVPGTPAEGKLQADDVIKKINQTEIDDLSTLARSLVTAMPDEALTVAIERDGRPLTIELTPTPVAGPLPADTIEVWKAAPPENKWDVQKLRLPDVANLAAYVAPNPEDVDPGDGLAMVMLLLSPDQRDPEEALQTWREAAGQQGVVVCAVCSEDESRWQQKEIDVISRMTTLMTQRVPIAATAVAAGGALEGVGASAADSMVIAIALSDRKNFSGISVSEETKPPAVRLRENEPDQALQLLMPIKAMEDGPTWLAPLQSAGYPITLGGELDQADLLRWTRLLQTL